MLSKSSNKLFAQDAVKKASSETLKNVKIDLLNTKPFGYLIQDFKDFELQSRFSRLTLPHKPILMQPDRPKNTHLPQDFYTI